MQTIFGITKQPVSLIAGEETQINLKPGDAYPVIDRKETKHGIHVVIDVKGHEVALNEALFLVTDEEERQDVVERVLKDLEGNPVHESEITLYDLPCKVCGHLWEPSHYIQKKTDNPGPKTCYSCRTGKKSHWQEVSEKPLPKNEADLKIAEAVAMLTPSPVDGKKTARVTLSIREDIYQMAMHLDRVFGISMSKMVTRVLEDKIDDVLVLLPELKQAIEMQRRIDRQKIQ